MEFGLMDFLNLLGSLAFFIYGMKIMSEAIQRVAGSQMRQILSSMTSNRFKGVLTGFLITSLVQSSSATTVLVVSFVNAGLLSLVESIGVIMGANIGTTITAWLISIIGFKVKISSYALVIIALAFPLLFFSRDKVKTWGEVFIGFALLFMGLAYLKDAVPDLKSNPEILSFLSAYSDLGFVSVILFVAIGTLLTVIVQSSSAAMALTLVMANNGWIPLELAAAMVLGENIGTTITANLAALVGNVHAKRAAFAHLIFNVFGVIWILIFMSPVLSAISSYLVYSTGLSPETNAQSIPIALSIFHTTFNILNTLFLVGLVRQIAKIVERVVGSKGGDADEFRLEYIGTGLLNTAELSLEEAQKETAAFGQTVAKMSGFLKQLLNEPKSKKQKKLIKKMRKYEEITDRLEEEIAGYLAKVSDGSLSSHASARVVSLMSIINDLERIGDVFFQMSKDFEMKKKDKISFTKRQTSNLFKMVELLDEAIKVMVDNLDSRYDQVTLDGALAKEQAIDKLRDKLREDHILQMQAKDYDIEVGALYKDLFQSMEKVGDHVINVTEGITGETERHLKKESELV
ncbi:Na/Pi cotransporter family protein [Marinoscillum furvescens]|uniref:Phosphate:Na+ symporter n=1 Tax=Marinoscillum furvescens DSM 4134 TaxID=1122208 RepID=A0A3D9LJ08_MARFU|nr:Na/Pi cotransporter family protein [Marinoscillum furvescens]REE05855.1 phosphate:Na+ symporter [Marinoscillum furvescens DSM 4134]